MLTMELLKEIEKRRSIRAFEDGDISDEEVQALIDAARFAPSWANTQCWEFIAVKDAEGKKKLAEALPPKNPARNAVECAPLDIIVCGKKGISGAKKGEYVTELGEWLLFDCGIATQNICLQAYSMGLGSVIVGYFDSGKVREAMGVPPELEVVCLIPIGKPKKVPDAPKRKEIDEILHREKF